MPVGAGPAAHWQMNMLQTFHSEGVRQVHAEIAVQAAPTGNDQQTLLAGIHAWCIALEK